MVRQRRIYYSSAVYHVTARGNNRQMILKEKEDKITFLKVLSKFKERFSFKLYGFCLMDNHFHIVIEVIHPYTISRIMQSIMLSYGLSFRKSHSYIGHLFQGRFKSNVIEQDHYIRECIEYIHNNPIRAKMVNNPEEYPWSNFYLYHSINNDIIQNNISLDRFGDSSFSTS